MSVAVSVKCVYTHLLELRSAVTHLLLRSRTYSHTYSRDETLTRQFGENWADSVAFSSGRPGWDFISAKGCIAEQPPVYRDSVAAIRQQAREATKLPPNTYFGELILTLTLTLALSHLPR